MNKKHLYKVLCLLATLTVYQADAAYLTNPFGSNYSVTDYCSGCVGTTDLDISITANAPITLNFDPIESPLEDISLNLINDTGTGWNNLTIEYTLLDPFDTVVLGLSVLAAGTSTPTVDAILNNPNTGAPTGLAVSFAPDELSFVTIVGTADRLSSINPLELYSITISTNPVPVPAAIWLFGSGLIGLVGVARRKKA